MSWIESIVIVIIVIYFQFAHLSVLTWLTNLCIISQGYGIDGTTIQFVSILFVGLTHKEYFMDFL